MQRDAEIRHRKTAQRSPAPSAISGLGSALLIIFLIVQSVLPAVASDGKVPPGKARLASDLLELVQKRSPSEKIRVVATLKPGFRPQDIAASVSSLGGNVRMGLHFVGQVVMELPVDAVTDLESVPGLDYITPDRPVQGVSSHIQTTTGAGQFALQSSDGQFLISSTLFGYDGRGVGVAVIDSGIDQDHFDLRSGGRKRIVLAVDFVQSGSPDDPYGHGTHVAGIVAGNGWSSQQAGLDYSGIAPAAHLLNLHVLDDHGRGSLSKVIAAIDFAIGNRAAYNIRVINLSLAAPPVDSYRDDPLCQAVERAAKAGLVVAAAAGNFGIDPYGRKVYGGIASPGISPAAITVGAVDTRGTDVRSDDVVAPFSSRGATRSRWTDPASGEVVYDNLVKPDLVAPGSRIVSLERYDNLIVRTFPDLHVNIENEKSRGRYMLLSGTSMSTGVVSGAAALVLQANPSLTPNMVKAIFMYSAQMMNGPDLFEQGAGEINIEGAVRLARALRKDAGSALPGQTLAYFGLPQPQSTIAGETFVWSQGLIWGGGWLTGAATLTQQQAAYAQSLIWGGGMRLDLWGAGVTCFDGLFSDNHVVYGQDSEWRDVTWDGGTTLSSGLIWRDDIWASGVVWQNQLITEDFFSLSSSSLIWGITRYGYDVGLIWGLDRYAWDVGLIWGLGGEGY